MDSIYHVPQFNLDFLNFVFAVTSFMLIQLFFINFDTKTDEHGCGLYLHLSSVGIRGKVICHGRLQPFGHEAFFSTRASNRYFSNQCPMHRQYPSLIIVGCYTFDFALICIEQIEKYPFNKL